jgi:3,4-dihydroxy 2-butanone 4-phosphate synthase/GTP cyclohydrolase II
VTRRRLARKGRRLARKGLAVSEVQQLSPIADVLDDLRNGQMIVLVDDEDRENEGDLIVAAQMATPDAVNFMAKYGRGLICLALTRGRVEELGLPLMARNNLSRHQTAFTISIEAGEGVTTGISASDRAHTIAVAIDPTRGKQDIISPGHVFPLVARDGGVLVRAGHTEAAVDLTRLAGLNPAGVLCEVMNDDGTMARLPDLAALAKTHGLKIATIADLISYRLQNERFVERVLETNLESRYGGHFRMIVYANKAAYVEHVALVKGDLTESGPVLVRVHAFNVLDDVLGDLGGRHHGELHAAMRLIGEKGRGVVVLIREPRPTSLSERLKGREGAAAPPSSDLRDYGVGAQILLDLGVRDMILLSNTKRTIVGLEGYGLSVVDRRAIPVPEA